MTSTFFGLNIAVSALMAQQKALEVTAQNVANANTEGYTRQEAHMVAGVPFPVPIASMAGQAGQLGTGVDVAMIRRLRDTFLDSQVRSQVGSLGYWETKQDYVEQIESVFNEPSDQGINNLLTKFWGAWQDLAANPESYAARVSVVQSATVLASVIQRDYTQLQDLRTQADDEIASKISQVNDWLAEIASLNRQIGAVEVQVASDFDPNVKVAKDQANDLRDRRDLLLDKLSRTLKVGYREESDGTVTIWLNDPATPPTVAEIADPAGKQILVHADTRHYLLHQSMGSTVWDYDGDIATADTTGATPTLTDDQADAVVLDGELKGLLEMRDSALNEATVDSLAYRLNELGRNVINIVNGYHQLGHGLTTDSADSLLFFAKPNTTPPPDYVTSDDASDIQVNPVLLANPNLIRAAASGVNNPGDGDQAQIISEQLRSELVTIGTHTTTVSDWYRALISHLGIDGQQARDMTTNQGLLVDRLVENRESFSGVSLDEEATNVIRYERAYQAAARVMNAMDEMLETLVNGVGIVGR
ncbi:MAG: flagellar hook-associated protein FlgK [Chloroflexota bacterium]